MRLVPVAAAAMAGLMAATPAAAQSVWQNGRWVSMPARTGGPLIARTSPNRWPNRWGAKIQGRWHAGVNAPGGWGAYRRPVRGWTLPSYWFASSFYINDYLNFGLSAPPYGYTWARYYDDAVLIDRNGRVWDSVSGIRWDGDYDDHDRDTGYGYGGATAHSESHSNVTVSPGASYAQPSYSPPVYAQPAYPDPVYTAPGYPDQGIPAPGAAWGGGAPPVVHAPPAAIVQPVPQGQSGCAPVCVYQNGRLVSGGAAGMSYYGGSSSYYGGGYYAGGGSTTTVVINSAPVTTTTVIEEVIEEEVATTTSYVSAPRRVVRRAPVKRWKPKPKPRCSCVCTVVCR